MNSVSVRVVRCRYAPDQVVEDGVGALVLMGLVGCELSVVLCGDAFIRRLNARWRGKDRPTDVLSFPQAERRPGEPVPEGEVLGDIVISIPTARRQAREHGRPVEEEVRALLVHGLLHLLGYDHEEPEEAARMEAEERALIHHLAWKSA